MSKKLSDFKALTFDCYGTLIDWESGIWDALQPLISLNKRSDVTRNKALKLFGALESAQQADTPQMLYPEILVSVHQQMAARLDMQSSDSLDQEFGASVAHWPAFPDSADALRLLKTRYRLIILSNISRDAFAASNKKLGVEFDAIYTAQDIGSYKPAPANFDYLLEHIRDDFDLEKNDILHTAQSLFHDHVPARKFGLANAWIDRQKLSDSGNWGATAEVDDVPDYDFLFFSMQELAAAASKG